MLTRAPGANVALAASWVLGNIVQNLVFPNYDLNAIRFYLILLDANAGNCIKICPTIPWKPSSVCRWILHLPPHDHWQNKSKLICKMWSERMTTLANAPGLGQSYWHYFSVDYMMYKSMRISPKSCRCPQTVVFPQFLDFHILGSKDICISLSSVIACAGAQGICHLQILKVGEYLH